MEKSAFLTFFAKNNKRTKNRMKKIKKEIIAKAIKLKKKSKGKFRLACKKILLTYNPCPYVPFSYSKTTRSKVGESNDSKLFVSKRTIRRQRNSC